jgi:hypothetical protein
MAQMKIPLAGSGGVEQGPVVIDSIIVCSVVICSIRASSIIVGRGNSTKNEKPRSAVRTGAGYNGSVSYCGVKLW